ncbi:hypothetical protein [Dokdonella koreensis]|uniref:Uncharacterized protein n=1 Tax=Dokdonella koreensis DS-123 TaxID=1300342 RepID=A0A167H9C2_9GAMM|nr:hypothetical protein [Dokdonella koreensis]ANB19552.1 Hypothetical protein I596_3564 [Dokdonella koreensis DS-123]
MKTSSIPAFALVAVAGLAFAVRPIAARAEPPVQAHIAHAHAGGIWKAAVPAHEMQAEFDRLDAYGLAVGARIQADCSLNWVDPDDGRRYCFASGTSLVYFLESPRTYLAQARGYWQGLKKAH